MSAGSSGGSWPENSAVEKIHLFTHASIHLTNKYLASSIPRAQLGAVPAIARDVGEQAVSEGEASITCEMTSCA